MIQKRIIQFCTLLILCLSVFGCNKSGYDQIATYNTKRVDGETYGEVHTIGAADYYTNDEAPNYSIFKIEDDESHFFSTKYVDEDLSFTIPEGNYTIASEEIGTKDFEISESDESICIVLDYKNKEITITYNSL